MINSRRHIRVRDRTVPISNASAFEQSRPSCSKQVNITIFNSKQIYPAAQFPAAIPDFEEHSDAVKQVPFLRLEPVPELSIGEERRQQQVNNNQMLINCKIYFYLLMALLLAQGAFSNCTMLNKDITKKWKKEIHYICT